MDFFDLVDLYYGPAGTRWAALFLGDSFERAGAIQPPRSPGTYSPTARLR